MVGIVRVQSQRFQGGVSKQVLSLSPSQSKSRLKGGDARMNGTVLAPTTPKDRWGERLQLGDSLCPMTSRQVRCAPIRSIGVMSLFANHCLHCILSEYCMRGVPSSFSHAH